MAAADGRRLRRQRAQEAVGEVDNLDADWTPLVSMPGCGSSTIDFLNTSVEAAVREEISALGGVTRPGLAAAAIALAAVLDNPRATSSKPPAAGALVNILNQLRKSNSVAKTPLAAVRAMTSADSAR